MRSINTSSVSARLYDALQYSFEDYCDKMVQSVVVTSESEIEALLAASFLYLSKLSGVRISSEEDSGAHIILIPQYRWKSYRMDFYIKFLHTGKIAFIECDGHDYHERTKEQAEKDRLKDRTIQASGIHILRFTGLEIWRDPIHVTVQILKFIGAIPEDSYSGAAK